MGAFALSLNATPTPSEQRRYSVLQTASACRLYAAGTWETWMISSHASAAIFSCSALFPLLAISQSFASLAFRPGERLASAALRFSQAATSCCSGGSFAGGGAVAGVGVAVAFGVVAVAFGVVAAGVVSAGFAVVAVVVAVAGAAVEVVALV